MWPADVLIMLSQRERCAWCPGRPLASRPGRHRLGHRWSAPFSAPDGRRSHGAATWP